MASCAGYSRCSIRFVPKRGQQTEQHYSDRSTVELRQHDFANYSLQAVDVNDDRKHIFEIPLINKDQYSFGTSSSTPDKIDDDSGTYYLSLDSSTRAKFHENLQNCFREIALINESYDSSPERIQPMEMLFYGSDSDDEDPEPRFEINIPPSPVKNKSMPMPKTNTPKFTASPEPPKLNAAVVPPKDLILDTHRLGKYIENGDEKEATQIITSLCNHGVQLQAKSLKSKKNDKKFTIHVQIDGNDYGVDQHGPRIPLDVYQSTTVRELRATFELAYQQLPPNQYFFVNGTLAHDNSTMQDLNVGPESIFVLFLLSHPKK